MAEAQSFQKILLGIASAAVGALLLYQAYVEQDEFFILAYWALGIIAVGAGLYLLISKPKEQERAEPVQEPRTPEECPACGTPVASAGKFCGSCGAPLTAREVAEE